MHHAGHYGVTLALYAPVGCALLVAGWPTLALAGGVAALALTMLPDLDSRTRLQHRGPTHSVAFAALVGLLAGIAAGLLALRLAPGVVLELAGFGFLVGALAILAHLAADVITPMGVRVLWPASERQYTFDIVLASDRRANRLLLAVGLVVASAAWLLGTTLA